MKNFASSLLLIILLSNISLSQDSTKNVSFVAVPTPSFNEIQGFGLAVAGGLIYSLSPKDKTAKPSSTFLYGFYSANQTWIFALLQEAYFHQNDYWFDGMAVVSNFKFQYYQPFTNPDLGGINVAYDTDIRIYNLNFLRRIFGPLYAGIRTKQSFFNTTFEPFDFGTGPASIDSLDNPNASIDAHYSGIGFKLALDTRDNSLNPKSGISADFQTTFFNESIGSDRDFQIMEMSFNHYWNFSHGHVLASRFYSYIGVNDVPFEEQSLLGFSGPKGKDVRGYSSGHYRGNQLYDVQAEWRWNFYRRWGSVLFGALALSGNDSEELKRNGVLPAIGTGIRFNAAPSRNVNIGLDFAVGKNDYGIYFALSEAF
ncbi:MAG: BamA/TamA family outer membrane protein [Reichenbachiella sp.]